MSNTSNELRLDVDQAFLGLVDEAPGRYYFSAAPHLCRPDRMLYGGTAIAAAFAATERLTGRPSIWQTTQLIGTTEVGARIDVAVEVLAPGYRTSQVQVTGSVDGRTIFVSLGAAVTPNPDGHDGQIEEFIDVPPPEECPQAAFVEPANGWFVGLEGRVALDEDDLRNTRIWTRFEDGQPWTAARLAYVADVIPIGVERGLRDLGVGLSLDNTLRVGEIRQTDWVLLDVRAQQAHGGYCHGSVHLWTRDGHLLGTGSQTAKMTRVDFESLCRVPSPTGE
ncbi:MAG: thioesterase family protein [Actinobacteria bacterium]|nr:thioesterase family protein [Actinomycetota bacterium]